MTVEFYSVAKRIDTLAADYTAENMEEIEKCFEAKGAEYYFFTQTLPGLENRRSWVIPLKDKAYFAGDKNLRPKEVENQPGFFTIPLWNVLPFLEKVAEENQKNPSAKTTDALVEIVDDVINYRDEKGERIDNYRTDWFMTKIIFKLPPEKWKDEHIDFMRIAVKSQFGGDLVESAIGETMLPNLIKNSRKDLLLKLLSITLDFEKTGKGGRKEIEPIVKKYWIKDALMKHTESITRLCGIEAARIGIGKLKEINSIDTDLVSYLLIPTVEKSSQIMFEDDYVYQLVALVRDILEKCGPEDIRSLVDEILKDNVSILKRIAIHVINKQYDVVKDLFWNHQENLYEVSEHEVYELLKAHCQELEKQEIDKVIAWSEEIKYPNREGKEKEKVEAWKRKELLSSILESEGDKVRKLYDEYDSKAPGKLEHAGFPVWHETGWVSDKSPIETFKLKEMTNSEIAAYLRDYTEKGTWRLERISEQGLRNEMEKCVSENPKKFAEDMNAFLDVPTKYQCSIVIGFTKAWQAKNDFPVGQVLDFIEELIESEKLWAKITREDKKDAYEAWIISRIADLIKEGVSNDEHAFPEGCLPQIERLLGLLVEKAPSYVSDSERILDSILGSPRANVFSAVILYALRYARLYKKKDDIRWPESIKQNFTRYLDPTIEQVPDFILTLMRYLPNLIYLDKKWVFENIPKLFPLQETNRWKIVFEGYLTYSVHVYEGLYSKLRDNGHYAKAMQTPFGNRYVTEKLVQHICIAFIEDWERLDSSDSLIRGLLDLANVEQLSEMVNFLGRLEGDESQKKLRERIKPLWEALFELLAPKQEQPEYQRIIAGLYSWLGVVGAIDDDIKEWTALTARHIRAHYYESGLVEELAKHVDRTPADVGDIYIEMLNARAYPDYDQENIKRIIRSLYERDCKQQANTICNMYAEVGYYFLRELYEEYNTPDTSEA